MSDNRPRPSYQMTSPRGPAQPTPMDPYGSAWADESEPEIDVMEYVRLIWARKWLAILHKKGNYSYNFEASTILSNLAIKAKDYKYAIKVLYQLSRKPIKKTKWFIPTNFLSSDTILLNDNWSE